MPENEPEDVVDPLPAIREKCTEQHCMKYKDKLETCNERVRSKKKTQETCQEEMIDFMHCVDHCASSHFYYEPPEAIPGLQASNGIDPFAPRKSVRQLCNEYEHIAPRPRDLDCDLNSSDAAPRRSASASDIYTLPENHSITTAASHLPSTQQASAPKIVANAQQPSHAANGVSQQTSLHYDYSRLPVAGARPSGTGLPAIKERGPPPPPPPKPTPKDRKTSLQIQPRKVGRSQSHDSTQPSKNASEYVEVESNNNNNDPASQPKPPPRAKNKRTLTSLSASSSQRPPMKATILEEQESIESLDSLQSEAVVEQYISRARVVRRNTLLYQHGEDVFKTHKRSQLFELACLIELKQPDEVPPEVRDCPLFAGSRYIPTLAYRYPIALASARCGVDAFSTADDSMVSRDLGSPTTSICCALPGRPERRSGGSASQALLDSLPCLCYPDFAKAVGVKTFSDQYFVITVTDELGVRKFAYCCRFIRHPTNESPDTFVLPQVAVVVSPVQSTEFYFTFLGEAVQRLRVAEHWDLFREFLSSFYRRRFPTSGTYAAFFTRNLLNFTSSGMSEDGSGARRGSASSGGNRFSDRRGSDTTYSPRVHFSDDSSAALRCLGVDNLMIVFNALLCEKRILLIGLEVPMLCKVVQGVIGLLWPLEWPHTLIPVIPDPYVDVCLSPTPYIIGVLRSNLHKLKQLLIGEEEEFLLIMDLDAMGVIRDEAFKNLPAFSARCLPPRLEEQVKTTLRSTVVERLHLTPGTKLSSSAKMILEERIRETFAGLFVELLGHYREHVGTQQDGTPSFNTHAFVEDMKSASCKAFLQWFTQSGMFQVWRRKKLETLSAPDLFDDKIQVRTRTDSKLSTKNVGRFVKGLAVTLSSNLSFAEK